LDNIGTTLNNGLIAIIPNGLAKKRSLSMNASIYYKLWWAMLFSYCYPPLIYLL